MDDDRASVQLRIETSGSQDDPIVSLVGEIDPSTAGQLNTCLESLSGHVVVDLAGVTFMDSTGITAFVVTRKRLLTTGGSIHLRSVPARAQQVLRIAGIADWMVDEATT